MGVIWSGLAITILDSSLLAIENPRFVARAQLIPIDTITRDDLNNVTSIDISADGNYLYAAAFPVASVTVFRRDAQNGRLEHVQTITDQSLQGVTDIRLSPDGRCAAASACHARSVVLFRRNAKSGKLQIADRFSEESPWAIDVAFSPDSKFVYVADAGGPGSSSTIRGGVLAFRVTDDSRLQHVETNDGLNGCFAAVRGVIVHPSGNNIYVTASNAGTLVVVDRDPSSGRMKVQQIFRDDLGPARGLSGAITAAISPDGQFILTVAGLFKGDNAVSVFRRRGNGKITPVQELFAGAKGIRDFTGGNEITVSHDGQHVYASATNSNALACFRRDAATGKLSYIDTLTSQNTAGVELAGANAVTFSPDGEFLYLAAQQVSRYQSFVTSLGIPTGNNNEVAARIVGE